jgi:Ran GTPase-activating protein (RanGAP) involved in mRNA processing and transport
MGAKQSTEDSKAAEAKIDQIFNAFDRDGNGVVTQSELANWLRNSESYDEVEEDSKVFLETLDKNGDQQVSKEELAAWWKGLSAQKQASVEKACLEKIPTNLISDPKTQMVDLSQGEFTVGETKIIASLLAANKSIHEFDYALNNITPIGAAAIAVALEKNQSIQKILLSQDHIGEGAVRLAKALETNTGLQEINLIENGIDDTGAAAFAKALEVNKHLKALELQHNMIGAPGGVALANALKKNSTLAELNLENNGVGDEGAVAFAEALKTNKTIAYLNLRSFERAGLETKDSRKKIGEAGAVALAEALKVNSTLTALFLDGNAITEKGAAALAGALAENKTLAFINLEHNGLPKASVEAFQKLGKDKGTNLRILVVEQNVYTAPPPTHHPEDDDEVPPPPPEEDDLPPPPPAEEEKKEKKTEGDGSPEVQTMSADEWLFVPRQQDHRRESLLVEGRQENFNLRENPLLGTPSKEDEKGTTITYLIFIS